MNKNEALSRAMHLCSTKEYSSFEIEEKLKKWEVPTDFFHEILTHLVEEKYLSEERFARAYTNDKLRFNNWGRIKIRYMLQQHKISTESIVFALEQINEELYCEIVAKLVVAKLKSIKPTNDYNDKSKVLHYVVGKGFETDVVSRVYDMVKKK